jgi:arylsulfatase A-like enzyme
MVTHGDTFEPSRQIFSTGQAVEDQEPWSVDFYDDSILEFDRKIGALIEDLRKQGLLDKTILVIGSDHGERWDQLQRLPLIIRFPNGQHSSRLRANAQNLDIAPTLLDYLSVPQPDWMRGESLISGDLEQRPIFGVSSQGQEPDQDGEFAVNWDKVSAPFYQFGEVTLIYCQRWYRWI